jgi:tetratricopeptide (TPR) repeat protein
MQIVSAEEGGLGDDILLRHGKVELRTGRHQEALLHLAAAWARGHSEDAAVHAAAAASRVGREADAVTLLSRAIELRPQSARLRLARGAILVTENPAGAERDLEYAYRCRLERDVTCSYLGDLGLRLGDPAFARRFYEEALRHDPLSAAARAGLDRLESRPSALRAGE